MRKFDLEVFFYGKLAIEFPGKKNELPNQTRETIKL